MLANSQSALAATWFLAEHLLAHLAVEQQTIVSCTKLDLAEAFARHTAMETAGFEALCWVYCLQYSVTWLAVELMAARGAAAGCIPSTCACHSYGWLCTAVWLLLDCRHAGM